MNVGERIKKLGFRRWYERTLLESHAYLVTGFLGVIVAFAGIEMVGENQGAAQFLIGFATAASGAIIAAVGIPRYLRILMLAQSFGARATCAQCEAYGAFTVTAAGALPPAETHELPWLKVRCRKCGNEWTM